MTRPTIEVLPPGANGITSVMARLGKDCACASSDAPGKPNARAAAQSHVFQICMSQSLPGFLRFSGGIVVERSELRNPLSASPSSLEPTARNDDIKHLLPGKHRLFQLGHAGIAACKHFAELVDQR